MMIDNGSGFRIVLGRFSFSALPRLPILGLLGATAFGVELKLPGPTGPFRVGRVDYHWSDDTRPEPLSKQPGAHRELMVSVWYPAKPLRQAPSAPYLADLKAIQNSLPENDFKELFRPADSAIRRFGNPAFQTPMRSKTQACLLRQPDIPSSCSPTALG